MGLGGVAIATLPSVIFPKLMFSDRLGGGEDRRRNGINRWLSTHLWITL